MIHQKLLNVLDDQRGLADDLAPIAGYNNGQAFRKALREERDFDKFYGILKVLKTLFPEDEVHFMTEYSKHVNPKKKNARLMLEYLSLHRKYDELRNLISKMKDCGNLSSKEWADIYDIDLKLINGELQFTEGLNEFGKINCKSTEMRICVDIMKAYCYIEQQNYNVAYQFIFPIEPLLKEVTQDYLKDIFTGKIRLILSECEFRNDRIQEARKQCDKIFNDVEDELLRSWACMHYGNSMIIESYENSIKYFKKGLELGKNYHKRVENHLKRSINFSCNFWGETPVYLDLNSKEYADIHEIAFYAIKHGQVTEAKRILNKVIIDELNYNQLGFHYYYRALISNNEEEYCQSVMYFKKSSDFHFINLPLIELRKLGFNEYVIKAMLA